MKNTVAGEKTIFYDITAQKVSERLDDFDGRTLNPDAIYDFLFYGAILPPHSIYQGINSLFPGEEIKFASGQPTLDNSDYHQLVKTKTIKQPINFFVDRLDQILNDFFKQKLAGVKNVALFLSGGIDSAIIASYLPKNTVCATWAGWGEGGTDLNFAKESFAKYGLKQHLVSHVDFVKDQSLYLESLSKIKQPFPFSFGAPYLRLAQSLSEYFNKEKFLLLIGQNADTITGSFRPTVYSYYLSKLNQFNPLVYLPGSQVLSKYKRKYFLLTSKNPVELLAFFHSAGLYPGPWVKVEKKYFNDKIDQLENQLGKKIRSFRDLILVDELMTEARRNQLAQNILPGLFGGQVELPYYSDEVIKLFLQVPQRIRRQNNFGKEILRQLALKRGVPTSVINKGKKGLAYGKLDIIETGKHLAVWDSMVANQTLNKYLNTKSLRVAKQNDFSVFDRLSSLHYYLNRVLGLD